MILYGNYYLEIPMAKRKFQIGDQVKVIKEMGIKNGEWHGIKIGREGKVIGYADFGTYYPYQVQFRGRTGKNWFNAKELELVN